MQVCSKIKYDKEKIKKNDKATSSFQINFTKMKYQL